MFSQVTSYTSHAMHYMKDWVQQPRKDSQMTKLVSASLKQSQQSSRELSSSYSGGAMSLWKKVFLTGVSILCLSRDSLLVGAQPLSTDAPFGVKNREPDWVTGSDRYQCPSRPAAAPDYLAGAVHPGCWTQPFDFDIAEVEFNQYSEKHPKKSPQEVSDEIADWYIQHYTVGIDQPFCENPIDRLFYKDILQLFPKLKPLRKMTLQELKACFFNIQELAAQHGTMLGQEVTGLRTGSMIVSKSGMGDDHREYLKEHDPALVKAYDRLIMRILKTKAKSFHQIDKSQLTKGEKQLIEKYFFFPPDEKEMNTQITVFFKELHKRLSTDSNTLELAAWIHKKIVEIHPFGQANGRTARTLLAKLLMDEGISPPVFLSNVAYTQAVNDESEGVKGAFHCYLVKLVKDIEYLKSKTFFFEQVVDLEPRARNNPKDRRALTKILTTVIEREGQQACINANFG